MKSRFIRILSPILLILVSCETTPVNHGHPSPLLYKGIIVSETTPDFTSGNALARSTAANAQIEENPPFGTVYGHESNSDNVYLSQGGELLPDGSWAAQIFSDTYQITLFPKSKATFSQLTVVSLQNAMDCQYYDSNGTWQSVSGDATVETRILKTGDLGTVNIYSDDEIDLELIND